MKDDPVHVDGMAFVDYNNDDGDVPQSFFKPIQKKGFATSLHHMDI
jgi:hypothetical protein